MTSERLFLRLSMKQLYIYTCKTNFNCDRWSALKPVKERKADITAQFYFLRDEKTLLTVWQVFVGLYFYNKISQKTTTQQ